MKGNANPDGKRYTIQSLIYIIHTLVKYQKQPYLLAGISQQLFHQCR